jgi:hypothetical protein
MTAPGTARRTPIHQLLPHAVEGAPVVVTGWVKTARFSKNISFVHVFDGSTASTVQAILTPELAEAHRADLGIGTAVRIEGAWKKSPGGRQAWEVAADTVTIRLTPLGGQDAPEPMLASNIQAIDGTSSPLRFRACFTTPESLALLTESYEIHDAAVPLNAPDWFDCFDAAQIGADLRDGTALAFMGEAEIADGVDRIVAVYPDGRAFAWHQLNEKFAD